MLRHTSFHPTEESTTDAHELPRFLTSTDQQQHKQHKNRRSRAASTGGWICKGCLFLLSLTVLCWQSTNPLVDEDTSRLLAATRPIDKKTATWDKIDSDFTIRDICRGRNLVQFDDDDTTGQNNDNDNKWTIVMTVNDGYYDFFLNWYYHFEKLGLQRNEHEITEMVLFAEDAHAYEKLTRQFPQQQRQNQQKVMIIPTQLEKLTGANQDQSFSFGNWKYVTLVAKRPSRMLNVLCTGRNVLYVDADTVWKSNPLVYLDERENAETRNATAMTATSPTTIASTDGYMIVDWEDKKFSHGYNLCTGFMAIKANRYGLEWINNWERRLKKKDMNQGVWNMVYSDFYKYQEMDHLINQINTVSSSSGQDSTTATTTKSPKSRRHVIRPLSSALFPNGRDFFENFTPTQRDAAVNVHANFIIGHDNKRTKLQEHGLWATAFIEEHL